MTIFAHAVRGLTNTMLVGVSGLVAAGCAFIIASELIDSFEETPMTLRIECALGVERPDCPSHRSEMEAHEAHLTSLRSEADEITQRILNDEEELRRQEEEAARRQAVAEAELRAKEQALVGRIGQLERIEDMEARARNGTWFETHPIPSSRFTLTVGTRYERITGSTERPEHYCYFDLPDGEAGEERQLYIRDLNGAVSVSDRTLRETGLNRSILERAHALCKPLIGRGG